MVYTTQNYWGFGLCPYFGTVKTTQNTAFQKLDVLSLMYQLTKPYKSSEISSITMTHWQNGLSQKVEAIMELLEVCEPHIFRPTIRFSNKKMAMGSSLSPIARNIFLEHSEKSGS
jgi:hypothetical protein